MAKPVGSVLASEYWGILPFSFGANRFVKYKLCKSSRCDLSQMALILAMLRVLKCSALVSCDKPRPFQKRKQTTEPEATKSGLYPSPPDPLSPKRGEGEKTRWDHANSFGFRV